MRPCLTPNYRFKLRRRDNISSLGELSIETCLQEWCGLNMGAHLTLDLQADRPRRFNLKTGCPIISTSKASLGSLPGTTGFEPASATGPAHAVLHGPNLRPYSIEVMKALTISAAL
jgi:hypothetical protein